MGSSEMNTSIRRIALKEETGFTPLGVLGYCLTRTGFLEPLFADFSLPLKEVDHTAKDKLQDIVVSILAGCRSISQVNTRIRPELALARCWQRKGFAEQSSLARTLDAFADPQLSQLRQGSERLFRRESRTLHHPFAADWLWLDLDFTPLPISKRAQGSTKGKIEGKKTSMDGSYLGCMRLSTTKPCSRTCTRAISPTTRLTFQPCKPWITFWSSPLNKSGAPFCAPMQALAVTSISIMPWMKAGKSWPRVLAVRGRPLWAGK